MENRVGREHPFWMWYFRVFEYYWKHELQIVWANFWCITNVPKVNVIKQSSFVTLHSAGWSRLRGSCVSLGSSLRFRFWSVAHVSIPEPKLKGRQQHWECLLMVTREKQELMSTYTGVFHFSYLGSTMWYALGNEMLTESRGGEVCHVSSGKALNSNVVSSGKSHPVGK